MGFIITLQVCVPNNATSLRLGSTGKGFYPSLIAFRDLKVRARRPMLPDENT